MPRIAFTDWRPDLARLLNQGVIRAKDCLPIPGGFGPMPSFVDAGHAALEAFARGALGTIDNARNPHNFAGTAAKLYLLKSSGAGLQNVTRASSGYSCSGIRRWEFAQFGDQVFAANPADYLQTYRMGTVGVFSDVLVAPRFSHLGVVREFLVGGNYFDSFSGGVPNGIAWSAQGDPLSWPTPGSDDALAAQSDRQPLEGGGHIRAVIGGAEIGAIFGESSIWRMDYRGGPEVFQLTRVEPDHGLLYPGLAVSFARNILHLAEDGWKIFDYTQSRAAGKGRLDSFFFTDFVQEHAYRSSALQDPDTTRVWVSYTGQGHAGGLPNKLLCYDWALDRFSHGDEAIEQLVRFVAPGATSLDDPPLENIDASSGSFDDAVSAAGPYVLGAWDGNHKIGRINGPAKNAIFETSDLELVPGRRGLLTEIRPLIRGGATTTFRVAALAKASDSDLVGGAIPWGASLALDGTGKANPKVDARYHRIETTVQGTGFVEALGFDLTVGTRGRR